MARGNHGLTLENGHPRSVISYIGGKTQLIKNIVPIISYAARAFDLKSYYELCGGGARMLLNLLPTLFEFRRYNDMDLGLCKLFACLGDKRYLYDLQALLEKWGYGEDVFLGAKQAREFELSMLNCGQTECGLGVLEGAASAFVVAMQSRAADCKTFDRARVTDRKRLSSYFKRIHELNLFYPTMSGVEVTHGDCREQLDMLRNREDAFAYLDPPYTPEEMVLQNHYGERSWTHADHESLVDRLLLTNLKVALSGYSNKCYSRLEEAGWKKIFLKNVFISSSTAARRRNSEYLWINFKIPAALKDQVSDVDYTTWKQLNGLNA